MRGSGGDGHQTYGFPLVFLPNGCYRDGNGHTKGCGATCRTASLARSELRTGGPCLAQTWAPGVVDGMAAAAMSWSPQHKDHVHAVAL